MTNADLIVQVLRDAGVRHAFGIPSGNTLPLMEAARAGGIEFVLMAHEGSAAFAAEVTGRLTGKPGFCLATLGPGATNLTTGVGCAFLDRSPLVAITCTVPTPLLGRRVQMAIDHHSLFRPLTKSTTTLRTGRVGETLADALAVAQGEPPGPVHLELPEDVSIAPCREVPLAATAPSTLPAPSQPCLDRIAAAIRTAKRPVAVLGASTRRLRNPDLLRQFVEHHRMPFATTTMAKGMIDERHPLAIGCIERARRQLQRQFLHAADLVVGIGYDVAEVEYEQWLGQVPLVSVDVDGVDADASVRIICDAAGDIDAGLAHLLGAPTGTREWPDDAVSRHRKALHAALRPATSGFPPHAAIDVAREVLPPEGILTFDVGAHTHQIAAQWTSYGPGQFLVTNSWSSMGFGIPAAIAAKLARPDLPVLCIVGDGCFQMTCGEVAAAKRLGLSIPILVLDDGWLSLIQVKQVKRQLPVYGTRLREGEAQSSRSHYFGAPAVTVRSPEELAPALREAFTTAGPTVIEALIDPAEYEQTVYD